MEQELILMEKSFHLALALLSFIGIEKLTVILPLPKLSKFISRTLRWGIFGVLLGIILRIIPSENGDTSWMVVINTTVIALAIWFTGVIFAWVFKRKDLRFIGVIGGICTGLLIGLSLDLPINIELLFFILVYAIMGFIIGTIIRWIEKSRPKWVQQSKKRRKKSVR